MLPVLLLGGLAVAAGIAIGVFWKEIRNFLKKTWDKIRTVIIPAAIVGFKTYLQTGSAARALYDAGKVAIQKFYSRLDNGKWKETTVAREISFEDLPEDLQAKLSHSNGQEVDISEEVKAELENELS